VIQVLACVNHGVLTRTLPVVVDEDVSHDRQHPTLEVGVVDELLFIVERLECSVLHQIVSLLLIQRQFERERKKIALHPKHRSLERGLVAHTDWSN